MVGGNTEALIQKKTTTKESTGERRESWETIGSVTGWLDYSPSADASTTAPNKAKTQETTHIFLCDYERWKKTETAERNTSENCRFVIDDAVYNVLMVDDPMNLHEHMEIYLKYFGGGLGVR